MNHRDLGVNKPRQKSYTTLNNKIKVNCNYFYIAYIKNNVDIAITDNIRPTRILVAR